MLIPLFTEFDPFTVLVIKLAFWLTYWADIFTAEDPEDCKVPEGWAVEATLVYKELFWVTPILSLLFFYDGVECLLDGLWEAIIVS